MLLKIVRCDKCARELRVAWNQPVRPQAVRQGWRVLDLQAWCPTCRDDRKEASK